MTSMHVAPLIRDYITDDLARSSVPCWRRISLDDLAFTTPRNV